MKNFGVFSFFFIALVAEMFKKMSQIKLLSFSAGQIWISLEFVTFFKYQYCGKQNNVEKNKTHQKVLFVKKYFSELELAYRVQLFCFKLSL